MELPDGKNLGFYKLPDPVIGPRQEREVNLLLSEATEVWDSFVTAVILGLLTVVIQRKYSHPAHPTILLNTN